MKLSETCTSSLKAEEDNSSEPINSLPLQGEGQGGGKRKGGVTRNARSKTLSNAKSLRKNLTEAEIRLWYRLRAKRFSNYKFRRQHAMGNYIVDFVSLKEKLIIELDGGQHTTQIAYDEKRATFLQSMNFRIIRFWNNEIMENMDGVLQTISDTLSLKGEGGDGSEPVNPLFLKGKRQTGEKL